MKEAKRIFLQSINKNEPSALIDECISISSEGFEIEGESIPRRNRPVYIVATGKASEGMGMALKNKFNIDEHRILCVSTDDKERVKDKNFVMYASHPYPTQKSVDAADKLIAFIKNIPKKAIVLLALSGGTSALVSKPADDIDIEDIAKVNELLLNSGASIDKINSVRKHLSQIKGGQLLKYFHSATTLIDIVISDVPGNDLTMIGSGLTISDPTTFQDARHILEQLSLWEKIPNKARKHIEKGLSGETTETLGLNEEPLQQHQSFIIGSAEQFAETMGVIAEQMGYHPRIADTYYDISVDKVIEKIMNTIHSDGSKNEPTAYIYYGESSVKVTGEGKGGRNQAMALRAAAEIDGMENTVWLSAGTDGIDGPTDAAGAIVNGDTIENANKKGLNIETFIADNDSYHFHEKMDTLFKTGATGNNMMDVVLVLRGGT